MPKRIPCPGTVNWLSGSMPIMPLRSIKSSNGSRKRVYAKRLCRGSGPATKFFTSRQHTVAGQRLSQDDIEHEILRKRFKDPRIHFAVICASSGCPQLPQVAYTAENVQLRLEDETQKYLHSKRGLQIDFVENTMMLSKLFDWFAGDFESKSGSVINFIKPYLDEKAMAFIDRMPKMSYLEYDWALNAKEPLK